jgi:hypothetical protein
MPKLTQREKVLEITRDIDRDIADLRLELETGCDEIAEMAYIALKDLLNELDNEIKTLLGADDNE